MPLPQWLKQAIESELDFLGRSKVVKAHRELSDRYRSKTQNDSSIIETNAHRAAYLAARLPATYASISRVLEEVRLRLPDLKVSSILDIGAGPGTAMWAASEIFPEVKQWTLLEHDEEMVASGKRLAQRCPHPTAKQAKWIVSDLEQTNVLPHHDLVICSYSVGELSDSARTALVANCWKSTNNLLIVIEPGTPVGFERIRTIRSELIGLGSHMVSPCPHTGTCPMANGDWCHFSTRLERSSLHRKVKGGSLGYEDEKFSYVAVSKFPCSLPESRVLRHPQKRSGHVYLTLCTLNELKQEIVSKRTPEDYRTARRIEWGDGFSRSHEK